MRVLYAVVAMSSLVLLAPGLVAAQDAKKGEKIFNQCKACHALDKPLVGPPLGGVVGRKAASSAGYNYSDLMKAAGEAGLAWSTPDLTDYLKNPTQYLTKFVKDKGKSASGQSKMFYLLTNEQQRKDVVAYLEEQK